MLLLPIRCPMARSASASFAWLFDTHSSGLHWIAHRRGFNQPAQVVEQCRIRENRLVAAELELRWNRTLIRVGEIESKIAAHDTATSKSSPLSATHVTALAGNLRVVWSAPTTDARLKKRILRTVIHEVVADIDDASSKIVLLIHWIGGVHTEVRLPKRRRGQRNSTSADIIAAVRQLVLVADDDLIAGILNRNGLMTGHGNRWTREWVTALRSYHNIPVYRPAPSGIEPWLNLGMM